MNNADRVIINTSAQYIRTAFNMCLSLYSTRLVLDALGVDDYGIYTLVAGVVAMLAFVVNALVITTQRYMSFYNGRQDLKKQKEIFCNSIFIHLVLGLLVAIAIELVGLILFDGFLNIDVSRVPSAKIVYHFVTIILVFTFFTAPFRALLISHENIVYISFVDVLDGLLKLSIAIYVASSIGDRLVLYVMLLLLIAIFNFMAFSCYDFMKYSECIFPHIRYAKMSYVREISNFAGWTIYSVGCITGRTQGLSIIINKFYGVAVNAAYGVAIQVNGALAFLSRSIMNAMNPQIVKAEGRGERDRMLRLAELESKLCFLLLGMIVVPCAFEMPYILRLWLKEVPDNAIMFCRFILLTSLVDQLTIGLGTANQAIGKIRGYSLAVNSTKLFSLIPITFFLFFYKNLYMVMSIYILFEFICSIIRLIYLNKTAGLLIIDYVKRVFLRVFIPISFGIVYSSLIVSLINCNYRFLITIAGSLLMTFVTTYYVGLTSEERVIVDRVLKKFNNHH